MNAGRRFLAAMAAALWVATGSGQIAGQTTVPDSMPPALPTLPMSSDATQAAHTTEALPPPAALPDASKMAVTSADSAPGSTNLSRPEFVRAIWVDAQGTALRTPDGIQKLIADCRNAGFNTIYAQVRSMGDALYSTTLVPTATGVPAGFDPLKELLAEARKGDKPIKIHALLVALRAWGSQNPPPENHVAGAHPDWLALADDGSKEMVNGEQWLDPGIIAVQDHLALIVTDIAKNYDLDGIQVDRIRYPELDPQRYPDRLLKTGYSPSAIERFNQEKGKSGRPVPTDKEWIQWRREQVTLTLKKMRDAAKAVKPNLEFSAGAITFGNFPSVAKDFGGTTPNAAVLEDWLTWCQEGLIDTNILMDYKSAEQRPAEYQGWMDFALSNKGKAKVVIGVGGFMNSPQQTAALMLDPILDPRADGVALYGYNDLYKDRTDDGKPELIKPVFDLNFIAAHLAELKAAAGKTVKRGDNEQHKLRYEAMAAAIGMTIQPSAPTTVKLAQPTPKVPMPSLSAATMPSLSSRTPESAVAGLPPMPGATTAGAVTGSPAEQLPSMPATTAAGTAAGSPVEQLPPMPGGTTSMPSLTAAASTPAASSAAGRPMPALSAAFGVPSGTAAGQMPSLPGAASAPVASASMPSLGAVAQPIATPVPTTSTGLPVLGATTLPGTVAGLPPLSAGLSPTSPVGALPDLPGSPSPAPGLPPLTVSSQPPTALPSLPGAVASTTLPSLPGASSSPLGSLPPLPATSTGSSGSAMPGLPPLPSSATSAAPPAAVSIMPALPGTALASVAPVPTPSTGSMGMFAPPDSGVQNLSSTPERPVVRYGSSNYNGEAMPGSVVAVPTMTPPSVMTPVTAASAPMLEPQGGLTGYYKQEQYVADNSEPRSAFGTPIPSDAMQRYTFSGRPTPSAPNASLIPISTAPVEVIVLSTGKEFAGRVVQRGSVWRIELPNGSVISMPGGRIATTRAASAAAPTPQAL